MLGHQGPINDSEDSDLDPATDQYFLISWADVGGGWPGTLPSRLLTAELVARTTFVGEAAIRFSSASTAAGHGFASAPVTVSSAGSAPSIAQAGQSLVWVPAAARAVPLPEPVAPEIGAVAERLGLEAP